MSFKGDDGWESHKQNYFATVEIKDYNVMIDGRDSFDRPIKNDVKTYDNIRKIRLDYPYFKKYYKLITLI